MRLPVAAKTALYQPSENMTLVCRLSGVIHFYPNILIRDGRNEGSYWSSARFWGGGVAPLGGPGEGRRPGAATSGPGCGLRRNEPRGCSAHRRDGSPDAARLGASPRRDK